MQTGTSTRPPDGAEEPVNEQSCKPFSMPFLARTSLLLGSHPTPGSAADIKPVVVGTGECGPTCEAELSASGSQKTA
jgi:hypothetical protein